MTSIQRLIPLGVLVLLATLLCGCDPTNLQDEVVASRVQGVSKLVARRLVTVKTSSATLVTTPEHPFAKVGAGWTRAADLTRGDRVQTAGGGDTIVLGVEIREVQPTAVHNLTVSKTHAYFVGSQDLLVHNTDCGRPSSARESRVRQREEDPNELREQFRARRAERKALLDARRREREQSRMVQQPFNDMPGRTNCALCSLAGLSGVDKLSTLIREKNLDASDPNRRLSVDEVWNFLVEWGLRSEDTPLAEQFPPTQAEMDAARLEVASDFLNGRPRARFPFQDRIKKSLETSSANTFVVAFEFWNGAQLDAHALLAVRRDNGTIVYIDLQNVPPTIHDNLDPRCHAVGMIPTNVDWRSNRQLSNFVKNGVHVPLAIAGHPDVSPDGAESSAPPAPSSPDEPFNVDDFFASDPEDAASP